MITREEQLEDLYHKAVTLSLIQKEQLDSLQRQGTTDLHTINSLMEINLLLRNCHNCDKHTGCENIKCLGAEGYFPSWKMRLFK